MTKVITYGTYDLLHYGHIRLLERAKALGDYLIVGITADDFDKTRGKINVQQSLIERIEAVRATGLADEIIIEEYEGQKIDDIQRYNVDIFTVGSDWEGKFDYLNEYCKVIYLSRTEGISSSDVRSQKRKLTIGLVGKSQNIKKFAKECEYVNGIEVVAICTNENDVNNAKNIFPKIKNITSNYNILLNQVDSVYIISHPSKHYEQIKLALENKKHVMCESPIALSEKICKELFDLAKKQNCTLIESIKTAYSTAYSRLLLLIKSGKIGKVVSVDSTCTSLKDLSNINEKTLQEKWNSICSWGTTAMLPVLQLLGTKYTSKTIMSKFIDENKTFDAFTKINFIYPNAIGSILCGKGIKSEGELIITGTKGYIYVPAPWWKMDYFEARFENESDNKRYFYQLDGEGIRYSIVDFVRSVETHSQSKYIDPKISMKLAEIIDDFSNKKDLIEIK